MLILSKERGDSTSPNDRIQLNLKRVITHKDNLQLLQFIEQLCLDV